jgi:DNA-binding transcriptional ArsR family regulator
MTYATILEALSDGTRRAIFERVAREPSSVGDLARELPVSQPAVSQHLKVLRDAGLLTVSHDGARHVHHVAPEGLRPLRDYLEGFWDEVLQSFKVAAERDDRAGKRRKRKTPKGGSKR